MLIIFEDIHHENVTKHQAAVEEGSEYYSSNRNQPKCVAVTINRRRAVRCWDGTRAPGEDAPFIQ